ncbi:hypothetical protein EXIGLDRAFT_52030 [Exidia glandulosa HHB12029]|uniref:F-box domain-containing protein n=1 Tax=Exidia glandulosa HHB12029 TaxID=1314781 RepID=A0A166MQ23_EXIGL|nr:hypothetical protein EXIGLDRAFT_52030 [Exidia glandulosa HHB12029]
MDDAGHLAAELSKFTSLISSALRKRATHGAATALEKHLAKRFRDVIRRKMHHAAYAWMDDRDAGRLARLDPSIVRRILSCLPLNDRLALSHTCRTLRDVLLGMSEPWSRISIGARQVFLLPEQIENPPPWADDPRRMWEGLITLTGRNRDLPSHISCGLDTRCPAWDPAIERLLHFVLSKASSLRLEPFGWMPVTLGLRDEEDRDLDAVMLALDIPSEDRWSPLSFLLRYPAPFLRTFELSVRESFVRTSSVQFLLHPDVLAGEIHALEECYLTGITLPPGGCSAFAALTLFDYKPVPPIISGSQLSQLMTWMPLLETLGFVTESFTDDMPWSDSGTQPLNRHARLRQVAVGCIYESIEMFSDIFSFIRSRTQSKVLVDFVGPTAEEGNPIRPGMPPHFGEFDTILADEERLVMRNCDCSLILTSWKWPDFAMDSATIANITSLTITSILWEDKPLPPAINLTHLCILLPSCVCIPRDMSDAPGVFVLSPWIGPWQCPSLAEVHLAASPPNPPDKCPRSSPEFPVDCTCWHGCTISLRDVYDFVHDGLAYSDQPLRRLRLSGIRGIAEPEPALAYISLSQLAETLEITADVDDVVLYMSYITNQSHKQVRQPTRLLSPDLSPGDESFDALGATPANWTAE